MIDIAQPQKLALSMLCSGEEQEGNDGPVSLHWLIRGNLFKA